MSFTFTQLKSAIQDYSENTETTFVSNLSNFIKIAEEHNLNPSKLAIAWCLLNQNVSTVILGASSMNQLEDNLDSLDCVEALKHESLVKALNNIGS